MRTKPYEDWPLSWARGLARGAFCVGWAVAGWSMTAAAAPDLVAASPDISIDPVPGAIDVVTDQDIVLDNLAGIIVEENLGGSVSARNAVELRAYHDEGASKRLLVFDTPLLLVPGIVPAPGDVVRYDGSQYEVIFDASARGIPIGVEIDAVTRGTDGHLVLSFDTHVAFGSFTAADEDLVRFDGSTFDLIFDGSAAGAGTALDIDAASFDSQGHLFVSFDTAGRIDGIDFADEDVLEYDPLLAAWVPVLAFDASQDASDGGTGSWIPADLQAMQVPEPTAPTALIAGALALAIAAKGRAPRAHTSRRTRP